MRIFLSVLILILNLQSWTKADDISDFQIEGMSIGDSLLKFMDGIDVNVFGTSAKYISHIKSDSKF